MSSNKLRGLKEIEEEEDEGEPEAHVLTAIEAEQYVEELRRFELRDVGSKKWMKQHIALERLNKQAHISARAKSDEFVLEAMLTFNKMSVLIYDLVLLEAWRERVFPLVEPEIAGGTSGSVDDQRRRCRTLRAYFVLYHEATVVNFLEVLCYHSHALVACGDAAIDLLDYCARRLAALQARAADFRECALAGRVPKGSSAKEVAAELQRLTPSQELATQRRDVEFSASVSCVALVRFICQYLGDLSVGAVTRLIETHDVLCSIVPLMENPPWTRARSDPVSGERSWEKLVDGEWKAVPADRLLEVTKIEAQVWLALYYLAMHPEIRKRYGFDAHRKQTLLRARRYLNDVVLDQLPLLDGLQRFMDELAIVDVPQPTSIDRSGYLYMAEVAVQRDLVLQGAIFDDIARDQRNNVWMPRTPGDDLDNDLSDLVSIYAGPMDDVVVDKEAIDEAAALDPKNILLPPERDDDDDVAAEPPPTPVVVVDDPPPKIDDNDQKEVVEDVIESVELASGDELVVLDGAKTEAKIVAGPDGRDFKREKWSGSSGLVLRATDVLTVSVTFSSGEERRIHHSKTLDDMPNALEPPPPRKLWRQVGDVADDLAAQILLVLE
ncbi:hypothetical protein CTAYLR_000743 [Chrysophaeum taylorii]|uniref:Uncharacterized protein n=1 Tax=Chrysophaeum taylorii TaxID=2483200 RepID=A0AAD7XUV0_9STRA|nr:hypothetical protein CTAYLR_000743 [Chrysophaeum taylorii]